MSFYSKILEKLNELSQRNLNEEERSVMECLMKGWDENRHVTQTEIAKTKRWMGCHPRHEVDINLNQLETTTRQVRQIINDLRIKHHAPILSATTGYWIPKTQTEVDDYVQRLEAQTISQIASYQATYKAMKQALNINSTFFEGMEK